MLESSWSRETLTAMHVVSLFNSYPNFPPRRAFEYVFRPLGGFDRTSSKGVKHFLNDGIDLGQLDHVLNDCLVFNQNNKFECKMCANSPTFRFFTQLLDHYRTKHSKNKKEEEFELNELFLKYLYVRTTHASSARSFSTASMNLQSTA